MRLLKRECGRSRRVGKDTMSQPPPWDQSQPPNQGPSSWPSPDPPPSWPSEAPNQGAQPSWPSGGPPPSWPSGEDPPPYPGPGYSYGYGPQPPRFRRRRPLRGVLIALGVLFVFGLAASAITSRHRGVSVTPFGSSASGGPGAGHQAAPGKIGSYFDVEAASGSTYRVTLVKVIDPARGADQFSFPQSGKRFVGLVFRIKALTGSPQNEDANNDAVLVGGNGQAYSADFDNITGYTNFDNGTIHVAQGGTVTGSVTFQVPDGVKVSKVHWTALSGFGSTVQWNVSQT